MSTIITQNLSGSLTNLWDLVIIINTKWHHIKYQFNIRTKTITIYTLCVVNNSYKTIISQGIALFSWQLFDIVMFSKNPATCGDTDCPSLHYVNFAFRATLNYAQHCITCNISLRATFHYAHHCITRNIALCATLHCVQHFIICNIILHATLHYEQHCIMSNIAVCESLH